MDSPSKGNPRIERGRLAWQGGKRGEQIAALWLRLKGYRILAQSWRSPAGEIDLIAKRGKLLVFVEVKQRKDGRGGEVISPKQRERITRAAALYLQRQPQLSACQVRFDAVVLQPRRFPQQIKDVWREGLKT